MCDHNDLSALTLDEKSEWKWCANCGAVRNVTHDDRWDEPTESLARAGWSWQSGDDDFLYSEPIEVCGFEFGTTEDPLVEITLAKVDVVAVGRTKRMSFDAVLLVPGMALRAMADGVDVSRDGRWLVRRPTKTEVMQRLAEMTPGEIQRYRGKPYVTQMVMGLLSRVLP